ncbi:MAG: hypothetical protein IH984_11885 [Planctomycetes bacterium]|nr:hypothetical protein [Planctomycetota bacterium]
MNTIRYDVRVERNKLALEVAKLPRLALRKLLDKWREECFKREPCEDGTYESRLDWDEFDSPVVVPTNLSPTSPAEAAVRLAVLHDYVFPDGDIEAICTKVWRDSLDLHHAISVICFEKIADDLDQAELVILERHLIDVQRYFEDKAKLQEKAAILSEPKVSDGWKPPEGYIFAGAVQSPFGGIVPRTTVQQWDEQDKPDRVQEPDTGAVWYPSKWIVKRLKKYKPRERN